MKSVLILGAGISGLGAAHVLLRHDVKVLISDLKDSIHDKKEKEALTALGAVFRFGPQSVDLLDGVDTVVVSPVIPRENPIVSEAFNRHIDVISEVELAYRVTKAPILAITGTNGKTTTTTLLGSMVSRSGKPFALAGNLGISLSREAELVPADGVIAAEVSSFQLEFIKTFKPRAAVILNITPDHLERHHTMEAYVAAKARIFENMDNSDCLLLNDDDAYTPALKKKAETHTHAGGGGFPMSTGYRNPLPCQKKGGQHIRTVENRNLFSPCFHQFRIIFRNSGRNDNASLPFHMGCIMTDKDGSSPLSEIFKHRGISHVRS
jgi:UDP-N-acetylmuramoylalanine--D-glutamate ligase